jgi:hypothetical protein
MIGILAYGSLIDESGDEIENATEFRRDGILTPFEVEYARKSKGRAYAPTLVPVGINQGGRVNAEIIALSQEIEEKLAVDMLYRREIARAGDLKKTYPYPTNINSDTVLVEKLYDFCEFEIVFYTRIGSNLPEILDHRVDIEKKGRLLACLAVESLTKDTYKNKRDGIQYLLKNIEYNVITPLTSIYCQSILEMSGGVPDLRTARDHFARQKGIR